MIITNYHPHIVSWVSSFPLWNVIIPRRNGASSVRRSANNSNEIQPSGFRNPSSLHLLEHPHTPSRRIASSPSNHYPSFLIASSISFIAGRPFFLNNICCLPLHTSRPPVDTVTVIGYLSTRFAITFAFGFALSIAAFAASNSCIPPSQL